MIVPNWVVSVDMVATGLDEFGETLCPYCGEFFWIDDLQAHLFQCPAPGVRTLSSNDTLILEFPE